MSCGSILNISQTFLRTNSCYISSFLCLHPSTGEVLCSPWSVVAPVLRLDVSLLLLLLLLVLLLVLLLLLTQAGVVVSEAQGWTWGVGVLTVRGPR